MREAREQAMWDQIVREHLEEEVRYYERLFEEHERIGGGQARSDFV
jgi:hypothetical protein